MLSTKTLLKNGRYRIDHVISAGASARIYWAHDNLSKQPVALIENENDDPSRIDFGVEGESLARLQHDGLVRINDLFFENRGSYSVTEPLLDGGVPGGREHLPTRHEADTIFERLGAVLLAINALKSEFPSTEHIEISPETFLVTADAKLKLLFAHPALVISWPNPGASPYLPLERVWEYLDNVTQRAIYKAYDENALGVLESPPDARSDLYSLGAVFYKLLTGTVPLTALERSIDILDTRMDALKTPTALNPAVCKENSEFVMRMLELRRERRFGSIEDAIFSLPSIPEGFGKNGDALDEDVAESELLELPARLRVPVMSVFEGQGVGRIKLDISIDEIQPLMELPASPSFLPQSNRNGAKLPRFEREVFPYVSSNTEPEQAKTSKNGKKLVAIVAAAVVLGAAGWGINAGRSLGPASNPQGFETTTGSDTRPAASGADVSAIPPEQNVPVSSEQPPPDLEEPTISNQRGPGLEVPARPRPQIAETRNPRSPEPKKASGNTPNAKKKLTVDDLINDN